MNFGYMIRHNLNKLEIPVDSPHLELAKTELQFIIDDLFFSVHSRFRQSRSSIVTVAGADEYILNKHFDGFVKHTLQGSSSSPRHMKFLEPELFFQKIRLQSVTSGDPYIYTFGEMVGVDQQLTLPSTIRVFSSLASKTTGSVNVTNGSDKVTSSADLFSMNDVGQRLQMSGDSKTYKIGMFVNAKEIQLVEKYRGATQSGASYKIGDVGIHVNVSGFVGGVMDSEDVMLDGNVVVTTSKTFTAITSVSKSDRTSGKITVENATSTLTVATLSPGETEIERQTVLLWPKPEAAETLPYRFFMKHPKLWLDTDRLLLPQKWHSLASYKLERRLGELFGKEISPGILEDIKILQYRFESEAEDLKDSELVPGGVSDVGEQFYYDKDEDLI